jgi:hypothetical protein
MCECPLPPMKELTANDGGHYERLGGKKGCPQYAEDQRRGGLCRFCSDAHKIKASFQAARLAREDFHDWELVVPLSKPAYAVCVRCGLKASPDEAAANIRWQDAEIARYRGQPSGG